MKIGFNINYFMSWMGGRSFLAMLVNAVKEIENCEVSIGLSVNNSNYTKISIDQIERKGNENLVEFCISTNTDKLCIVNDLETWITNEKIDIVGPSLNQPKLSIPSINYVPDFQHKYLPGYFDEGELATRELQYLRTLKNSDHCIVGDKTVADDIQRFYPWNTSKVFVLPPFLYFNDKKIQSTIISDEPKEISGDYLIVCSQRWQHKRHDLILNSFANYLSSLKQADQKNKKLIFTGDKTDYRSNIPYELFNKIINQFNLNENVIDLGVVDRKRQLNLIKNANSLITASEFEGGIGASGVQEAMIFGTPVIAPNTTIYNQNFPVDINLCDFKNDCIINDIFSKAFKKELLSNKETSEIEKIFKNSIKEIEIYLSKVKEA